MTGQNATRHRATNWINPARDNAGPHGPPAWNWAGLGKGDITLPGLLRQGGYRTIHIGKAHFGPNGKDGAEPLNLGFDINIGGAAFGAPGSYYAEQNYGHGTKRARNAVPHLDQYHGTDTFLTEALTIEAGNQVAAAVASGQPFFLHFSHYAVHTPFESDPRFAAHYTDTGKSPPAQAFATLIEGMDKSLNDLLDQLEQLGIAEDTLVIFLGDNGSDAPLGHQHAVACSAPLRGKKGAHYEGGMRVPFIAAWAKPNPDNPHQQRLPIAAGALQGQVASVMDLFPTVLAVAGCAAPKDHAIDGYRLDTLLTGQPDETRPETFLMHYPHGPHRSSYFTVLRQDDWKVIYHYNPGQPAAPRYELFNLARDPFEQHDLAAENPDRLATMIRAMADQLDNERALYPQTKDGTVLKPVIPPGT